MPALLVWFLGGLATLLQSLVPRILFSLGIGFATFTGFQVALDALKADVIAGMQGLPATVVTVLSLLQVDRGVSLVLSAWLGVVALRLANGVLTRLTMRGVA